ncbi:hypothetical protein [Caldimonas sp. KR1-144]|uniref:hypothetical protein n=1 Tax=Caldimonas sp. KR1-144 TaxID=3400911 RepID=UPI003C0EBE4E
MAAPRTLDPSALAHAIEAWGPAAWLRESLWAYPLLNALHILGIAALLGGIAVLDFHLLRAREPVAPVARAAWPVAVAGVALAVATGPLLFAVKATEYIANPAFVWKFVLLTLALSNVALFHLSFPGVLAGTRPVTAGVRAVAALSLALWFASLLAGRAIAFL